MKGRHPELVLEPNIEMDEISTMRRPHWLLSSGQVSTSAIVDEKRKDLISLNK